RTYLGMGEDDINVHDQWACESMGAIQDRTREHLGTTDKVIMAHRRLTGKPGGRRRCNTSGTVPLGEIHWPASPRTRRSHEPFRPAMRRA
ncbi:MAG: hypothetical protein LT081_06135, partial [Hydrogenophaga sp.]|nr:hypothetical protein [Hydrogenophaga sp.]